jgi:hypothetical protein
VISRSSQNWGETSRSDILEYFDVDCNAYRSGEKKNDWSKVNTMDKAREADAERLREIAAGNWTGTEANATSEVRSSEAEKAPLPANATVAAPAIANEKARTAADSDNSGRRLRRFARDPANRKLRRGGSRSVGSGSGPSWGGGRRSGGSKSYYASGGRYGRVSTVADGYAISQTYYGHYYGQMAED